jgi:UDPglucose 6-dehydrogenase
MIGFAGMSHLGIVSAVATAAKGFDVVGYDRDTLRCVDLAAGRMPFFEPGLDELAATHRVRLRFTTAADALEGCDIIYLAIDVATDDQGRSDLSQLESLIDDVCAHAAPGTILVVLSQVPPGFTRGVAASGRTHGYHLYYQVETLVMGDAVWRALSPERVIVGCPDRSTPLPKAYAHLLSSFECPVLPMRYESAELTKISINMCLVGSISVANTMAELCERIGADWSEMAPALRLDRRIGVYSYLSPGLGIAGGNLERDLATVVRLAREHGTDASVVEAWQGQSRYQRDWVLRMLHNALGHRTSRPVIAVWGLAYKPDTTFIKNSPALALLSAVRTFGVRAYDPRVQLEAGAFPHVVQTSTALDACRGADVLVVPTAWREFAQIDFADVHRVMAGDVVIDPYGATPQAARAGFTYYRLGTQPIRITRASAHSPVSAAS